VSEQEPTPAFSKEISFADYEARGRVQVSRVLRISKSVSDRIYTAYDTKAMSIDI